MSNLHDRVAVVTGAGRGIGKMIAHKLAELGMKVAIIDVMPNLLSKNIEEFRAEGFNICAFQGDVSSKDDVNRIFDQIEAELGPIWLLVNNAGIHNTSGPTVDMSEEAWDRVLAIDAKGVFLCSQAALKKMLPRHGGRIVNMSSIAGLIARSEQIAYCSAKAAVIHLSRCLAVEVAPYGITVNCLCPGPTRTEMLNEIAVTQDLDFEALIDLIPDGRLAEPIDHAYLVAFFANEESAHITGQVIAVDGGQTNFHPLVLRK